MIHRLPVPTPFRIGLVNCYLIEDDPLTLVDVGPNSAQSLDALERLLAEHGRRVEDLERLLITHQHMDHLGLADVLARRSGAEVWTLDVLAPVMEQHEEHTERDDAFAEELMLRHGIPHDVALVLRGVSRSYRGWGSSAPVARRLADGEEIAWANRTMRVRHRPGHSPSDTLFVDEASGVALVGDHLIEKISSNPVISIPLGGRSGEPGPERPHALRMYMRSLRETAEEPLRTLLPGHGEPVTNHVALVESRFELHERRAAKIHELLLERPRSGYELATALWGNVAVTQAYLTLSEVLGHIDLLAERGLVREDGSGEVVRFEPG